MSLSTTNLNNGNPKHLDTVIWSGVNLTSSTSTCGGSFTSIRQSEAFAIRQDPWHVTNSACSAADQETEVSTRPIENVVLTTKGLQERSSQMLDGTGKKR